MLVVKTFNCIISQQQQLKVGPCLSQTGACDAHIWKYAELSASDVTGYLESIKGCMYVQAD